MSIWPTLAGISNPVNAACPSLRRIHYQSFQQTIFSRFGARIRLVRSVCNWLAPKSIVDKASQGHATLGALMH